MKIGIGDWRNIFGKCIVLCLYLLDEINKILFSVLKVF